jgi:hypothetical protein
MNDHPMKFLRVFRRSQLCEFLEARDGAADDLAGCLMNSAQLSELVPLTEPFDNAQLARSAVIGRAQRPSGNASSGGTEPMPGFYRDPSRIYGQHGIQVSFVSVSANPYFSSSRAR